MRVAKHPKQSENRQHTKDWKTHKKNWLVHLKGMDTHRLSRLVPAPWTKACGITSMKTEKQRTPMLCRNRF